MKQIADVKIAANGWIANVYVDGKEIRGVLKYYVKHKAGRSSKLYLEINADRLEFIGKDVEVGTKLTNKQLSEKSNDSKKCSTIKLPIKEKAVRNISFMFYFLWSVRFWEISFNS